MAYEARVWRCDHCTDLETGESPFEFLDAQLMAANDAALATAWRNKYGDEVPATGRPGRKTDAARTERVAVLLTAAELDHVDAKRGSRSRSDFLREMIAHGLHD